MAEIRVLDPEDVRAYGRLRLEALETEPLAFGSSAADHRALGEDVLRERLRATEDAFTLGAFLRLPSSSPRRVDREDASFSMGDEEGPGVEQGEVLELVGIVGFSRVRREKNHHRGDVAGMYVAPEGRGRGIGRALLTELLRRARGLEGLERVGLAVATQAAAARALYRSQGFVAWGVEPQAIKHGDAYSDVECMTLDLRPS